MELICAFMPHDTQDFNAGGWALSVLMYFLLLFTCGDKLRTREKVILF